VPETAVAPCFKVNVVVVIVKGSITSLKVAEIFVLVKTPVAALAGTVELTMGAVVSGLPGNQCPVSPPPPHPVIKKTLRIKINKR
jgi:hypothetical protein